MRAIARSGLLALSAVACALTAVSVSFAQAPPSTASKKAAAPASAPATKSAAAPASAAAPTRPAPTAAELNQPVATVNGETITRGELINFLSRYRLPDEDKEQIYQDAVDTLVNTHLVSQFLERQKINVPEQKVNEAIAGLEKELKENGMSLAEQISRSGMPMETIRKEYTNRLRWIEYLNSRATDTELQAYATTHKDLFNGTQVKASHILLKLDPKATAADKEKIKQRLIALKKDILAKKITFSEAANKNSEDPANTEGAGGDIGYFGLNDGLIEEFARAAFALKKGEISDPVETPYGMHLIEVSDRKEGTPFDFEANKPLVKQVYAAELQKSVLSSERKKAEAAGKIVVKPMPADLFPPAPAQPPAATAAPATTPAPAGSSKAATKK